MALPGSRSNRRNEGQGYPRPGGPRPSGPSSSEPFRRPVNAPAPTAPAVAPAPGNLPTPAMQGFISDELRELIKLMTESDLTEINIETSTQKLLLRREPPRVYTPELSAPAPRRLRGERPIVSNSAPLPEIAPISDPGAPPEDAFHKVTAPMVGTFYHASDPKARAFAQEGDMVEKGQVIGIIEAMKIMNEIQSEHSGRCMKVLVENGQPVEYGQALLVLEPA